jgi:hypothetical protein
VISPCNFYRIRICLFLLEIHYFQYIVYGHEKICPYTVVYNNLSSDWITNFSIGSDFINIFSDRIAFFIFRSDSDWELRQTIGFKEVNPIRHTPLVSIVLFFLKLLNGNHNSNLNADLSTSEVGKFLPTIIQPK